MLYIVKYIKIVINFHWYLEMTSNCELKTLQLIIGKIVYPLISERCLIKKIARSIFASNIIPEKSTYKENAFYAFYLAFS